MKNENVLLQQNQESIREAIESQQIEEQRDYYLGHDGEGNSYIHFPQFCGADLRVYKQAPVQMPKLDRPKKEKPEVKRSNRVSYSLHIKVLGACFLSICTFYLFNDELLKVLDE